MVLYIIMEEENSLLRKLLILWHGRKFILSLTIIAAVISLAYAFYLPLIYKADCNFIPPNQYMNKLGVFVSLQDQSDRVGGLSNQSVVAESVTSSQMIMGLMKQNSVLDAITDRFSLMEVYKQKSRGKMREYIVKKLLELEEDAKSGIITVGFLDENPKRAADIANAFVEILQDKIVSLARHDAEQKRIFFEKQLFNARLYLDKVQNELIEYQEKLGGVTIPRAQMEATLRSITDLRQNIAAKQAEISAMRTYAPSTNPKLRAAISQLETMTKELERLEAVQRDSNPQLGVEYHRYETRVNTASRNYDSIMRKLEEARIDESQTFFQLQIVEYASPPDMKYKPSRARIVILGTFIGFLLGCFWVVFADFRKGLKKAVREYSEKNPEIFTDSEIPQSHEVIPGHDAESPGFFRRVMVVAPVLLFMAVIALLTFQPPEGSNLLTGKFQMLASHFLGGNVPAWISDKLILRSVIHFFLYLPLGAAVYYVLRRFGVRGVRAVIPAVMISGAFGLADEAVKMFLPGREFDFADWLMDMAGSFAGVIIAAALGFLCSLLHSKKENALNEGGISA